MNTNEPEIRAELTTHNIRKWFYVDKSDDMKKNRDKLKNISKDIFDIVKNLFVSAAIYAAGIRTGNEDVVKLGLALAIIAILYPFSFFLSIRCNLFKSDGLNAFVVTLMIIISTVIGGAILRQVVLSINELALK